MNTRLALTPALGLLLALAACGEDATTDASEGTSPLCQEARGDDGSVTLTCADSEAAVQAGADGVVRSDDAAVLLRADAEGPDPAGCAAGGTRVSWGKDLDFSGTLDDPEVEGSRLVCDGVRGADAPVMTVAQDVLEEGGVCLVGGTLVRVGYDDDADGELSPGETQASFELCTPPCDRGFYYDVTLSACRPGQIIIAEGTVTQADPNYPAAALGDPFRFALIYDIEEDVVGELPGPFDVAAFSYASYQLASFVVAGGEITWRPPRPDWRRSRTYLGTGVSVQISSGSGLVGDGIDLIAGVDLDVDLPPGTSWAPTQIPPSSALGLATAGQVRVNIAAESDGVIGTVDRIATPQVFDPANLLPSN
jgi:hypothetical protein